MDKKPNIVTSKKTKINDTVSLIISSNVHGATQHPGIRRMRKKTITLPPRKTCTVIAWGIPRIRSGMDNNHCTSGAKLAQGRH